MWPLCFSLIGSNFWSSITLRQNSFIRSGPELNKILTMYQALKWSRTLHAGSWRSSLWSSDFTSGSKLELSILFLSSDCRSRSSWTYWNNGQNIPIKAQQSTNRVSNYNSLESNLGDHRQYKTRDMVTLRVPQAGIRTYVGYWNLCIKLNRNGNLCKKV